jgi:hypothetical protein
MPQSLPPFRVLEIETGNNCPETEPCYGFGEDVVKPVVHEEFFLLATDETRIEHG